MRGIIITNSESMRNEEMEEYKSMLSEGKSGESGSTCRSSNILSMSFGVMSVLSIEPCAALMMDLEKAIAVWDTSVNVVLYSETRKASSANFEVDLRS